VSGKFAFLSRFGMKFVEVGGAGLATAACGYVLGQMGAQQPPAPPPPIVQVMPPSEDAMRLARDEQALLAALVRKENERRSESAGQIKPESQVKPESAASATSAPAKPAKAPATQVRRNQKPEQAVAAEPQLRASEPQSLQPPLVASSPAAMPPAQNPMAQSAPAPNPTVQHPTAQAGRDAAAPGSGAEGGPIFALRQIPSWLLPDNERVFGNAPRPPMPVGEFLPSAM
jgi:hypothetical protein